ncbi:(2Fe-2S)-binding protein [Marinobacter orientalis]|uniref:(2Fe-2S)-binding protein n=1 Tax=Marinobacter orientalis TaxID=1928859 RepID=A0A7Y0RDG1_9GAMM|nr:(2Fe-2S)-binding protein [Marinobacter orientalis]NMT64214.1 (2Fe-2S)-binding protein [Marinobacter orientalis]TGX49438.1 (2Fe-2S)-binding protein [Marinobacter orientalis]
MTATWVERYARLLVSARLNRESIFAQALQPSPIERRGLFSLAQCLEQPALLVDQVKADCPQASDTRAVRARVSVLQQDLALNVIAPLTISLFRYGQAALPDPERIFLAPAEDGETTTSRWFQTPGAPAVDEAHFVRSVGRQTRAWYPVFRQQLEVSPGAYWSSIGLGLGAPFSMVWNLAEPYEICDLAQRWLGEFSNDANRFIDWIPAVFGGQTTAIPQRKGCCLKYLLPEGDYCGTCGVYRKPRLAALRHQQPNPGPGQWQPGR